MRRLTVREDDDSRGDLTFEQVAKAYTALTGKPMSKAYAEKIHRKALVKLRKRLAEQGFRDMESVHDKSFGGRDSQC